MGEGERRRETERKMEMEMEMERIAPELAHSRNPGKVTPTKGHECRWSKRRLEDSNRGQVRPHQGTFESLGMQERPEANATTAAEVWFSGIMVIQSPMVGVDVLHGMAGTVPP